MTTAIQGDALLTVWEGSEVRLRGMAGDIGIWAELGYRYRWGDLSSAGIAVRHGLLGTFLTTRVKRGATVIEAPVLLTQDYRDWKTTLGAVLGPAVANLIIAKYVLVYNLGILMPMRKVRGVK